MEKPTAGQIQLQGGNYNGQSVGWPLGVDSFSHPLFVDPRQLRWMENAVTQGAFLQVRPGLVTRATFDTNVNDSAARSWWFSAGRPVVHPQMMVRFRPSGGGEQLVFAISGTVFYTNIASDGSLGPITRIPGFQFNRYADVLVGCRCVQTATIEGGVYKNNIAPRNLLIIQDGVNRAGIWDGSVGVHANPQKKVSVIDGNTLYPEAWNQTRIGLWMAWSGNRLFVFEGPNGYASDLNDPTHFTEELNLQSFPKFVFPEDVTGAIDRGTSGTTRSQVVVFTQSTTWTLWSGIQNRIPSNFGVGWAFTDDFQTKIFDAVGCVAGKSAIVHRGLLYWKSQGGIVLFDSSQTVNSTQNLPPIDSEMAYSKMRVAPSAEGIDLTCAGRFDNYVFWSVPVGRVTDGRRYCAQTQVLDRQTTVVRSSGVQGPFNGGTTGWQGVWTGIRPVEWASARVGGKERVYALSLDDSGAVRIWEAFQANRADNGHRIPWMFETRTHAAQPKIFEYAEFNHFRLLMDQIGGNVNVQGFWRGLKGTYHELLNQNITATPGTVLLPLPQFTPIVNNTMHESLALQSRTVVSPAHRGATSCGSQNVESIWDDAKDHAFSIAVRVTGRAAVSAYLMVVTSTPDTTDGGIQVGGTGVEESGFNMVPSGGCPSHEPGETPNYTAGELPQQLVSCPYIPAQTLTAEYNAPTA